MDTGRRFADSGAASITPAAKAHCVLWYTDDTLWFTIFSGVLKQADHSCLLSLGPLNDGPLK